LTALHVELTDRIVPALGFARSGPGRPPQVTDTELVCLAVTQVLLRYDDERHWLPPFWCRSWSYSEVACAYLTDVRYLLSVWSA
jgi:hypothetical protein